MIDEVGVRMSMESSIDDDGRSVGVYCIVLVFRTGRAVARASQSGELCPDVSDLRLRSGVDKLGVVFVQNLFVYD